MSAGWVIVSAVLGLPALAYGAFLIYGQMVERPDYAVAARDGAVELRDYPALAVAEVTVNAPRREALRQGFSPLARYIFASDREGEKIAMTAPVTQLPAGAGDAGWRVRFILPKGADPAALPVPANAAVRLTEEPAGRYAAIRFSGTSTDPRLQEHEAQLRGWLAERDLMPAGPAQFAYYNDPFTLPVLRRNEVLIPLLPQNPD